MTRLELLSTSHSHKTRYSVVIITNCLFLRSSGVLSDVYFAVSINTHECKCKGTFKQNKQFRYKDSLIFFID